MTGQHIQQDAICYQWFKLRLILSISEPSITQRSQIKEDSVEPSVPAREFNTKAYAAVILTQPRPCRLLQRDSTYLHAAISATGSGKQEAQMSQKKCASLRPRTDILGVARWLSGRASDLRSKSRGFEARPLLRNNLRQVVHTLLPLSPSSIIWYQRKLGSKQAYRVVYQPVSRDLAVFADAWLSGWLAEISADLRETVAH